MRNNIGDKFMTISEFMHNFNIKKRAGLKSGWKTTIFPVHIMMSKVKNGLFQILQSLHIQKLVLRKHLQYTEAL